MITLTPDDIDLTAPSASSPEVPRVVPTRLELGDDVVFVTDADGVIIDVNEAFVRVTGYPRDQAIGSTPRLLSSGYQDTAYYENLWRTIKEGRVWQGQMVDRRRDGVLRTHHVTITPIRDTTGRITHFLAIERDVTGEFGRQLASGSTGLVHTDPMGRCVYASDRAASLLGRAPADLLGLGLTRALVTEDAEALREVVGLAIEGGRDYRLDVRSRAGRWLEVEVAPLRLGANQALGATCSLEDAEERMATRTELARQQALAASVLDALAEPVAVVAADGTVVATNDAWREARRLPALGSMTRPDVGDNLLTLTRRAALTGDDRAGVLDEALRRSLRRGGTPRRLPGLTLSPLAWEEGGAVLRVAG